MSFVFLSLFRAEGPAAVQRWELCLSLEFLWILSAEARLCAFWLRTPIPRSASVSEATQLRDSARWE